NTPNVPGPQTSWVMSTPTSTHTFSPGATASLPEWRARIFSVIVIGDGIGCHSSASPGREPRRLLRYGFYFILSTKGRGGAVLVLGCCDQGAEDVEVILVRRRQVAPAEQRVDDGDGRVEVGVGPERAQREPPDQFEIPVLALAVHRPDCTRVPLPCHVHPS